MSRRCSSRNRRAATAGFAALVALTRRTAEAQSSSANPAYGTYTYLGCFKDESDRAMPYVANPPLVTLDSCAALCLGGDYKFMGLQFEHEW